VTNAAGPREEPATGRLTNLKRLITDFLDNGTGSTITRRVHDDDKKDVVVKLERKLVVLVGGCPGIKGGETYRI